MSSGRRSVIIGATALLAWYLVTVLFWAVPKLSDSVPAGVDRRPAAASNDKVGPGVVYSQKVSCNNLFTSAARPDTPLPELPAQPDGVNKLGYQRGACSSVHSQARVLFILNTLFVIAAFAGGAWLLARHRRTLEHATAPSLIATAG